jgi:hypothetical protein
MARRSEFVEHVVETLRSFGAVTARWARSAYGAALRSGKRKPGKGM